MNLFIFVNNKIWSSVERHKGIYIILLEFGGKVKYFWHLVILKKRLTRIWPMFSVYKCRYNKIWPYVGRHKGFYIILRKVWGTK